MCIVVYTVLLCFVLVLSHQAFQLQFQVAHRLRQVCHLLEFVVSLVDQFSSFTDKTVEHLLQLYNASTVKPQSLTLHCHVIHVHPEILTQGRGGQNFVHKFRQVQVYLLYTFILFAIQAED